MERFAPARSPHDGTEDNLVVSIDLGTTFSGTSWVFLQPGQIPYIWDVPVPPGGDSIQGKVPTVLFYDRQGNLRAVGGETLDVRNIAKAEDQNWTRVEWFKLLLRPQSFAHAMDKAPKIDLPRNKKLVDVVADFLRYMATLAIKHFHEAMDGDGSTWNEVKDRVIYILSHPNGWNIVQHPIMREAAILANLIPDSEEGKNRIVFVSEGEASLHFCMSRGIGRKDLEVNDHFVVVDAGGGTLYISSFKTIGIIPLEFEESSIPECCLEGSVFVTQAFREYVQAKLRGSSFGHPAMIRRMIDRFDQYAKRNFEDPSEDMSVKFGGDEDNDPDFGIRSGRIIISGRRMASFYESACDAIVTSVKHKVVPGRKTIVVLVGGFAGSTYLFNQVKSRLMGPSIHVLRPNALTAKASASGVLCFYLDRSVKARMAKWTYGISCVLNFDPRDPKHIQRKSRIQKNPVTGEQYLEGGFFVTLKKGTVVQETEFTRFPFWHSQPTKTPTTLEITLECYRGDVRNIKFRDEDREDQFQELCWLKAIVPEASLVRRAQRVKTRNPLLRSTQYYYVSNFNIVVSFGATEFKCFIEWKDKKGKTQRGPITPVWNDDHDPSTSHSRHHNHDISTVKPYEPSSLVQAGTNLPEDDSSRIRTASTSSNISTPTSVDIEVPAPYMQRDRERTPRLPYQQGLFGSSITLEVAPFDTALPALIQSSEIHDGVVFGDLASVRTPLAWTGDIDFQFLDSQSVCTPSLIVACDNWAVSSSSEVLLFTLSSKVVLFNTARKTAREIDYGFNVKSTSSVAHSLSPDGKTLVRWILDEENQATTLLAIDVRRDQQIAKLKQGHKFQHGDLLSAQWINDSTIYIPIRVEGIIIAWNSLKAISRNNLLEDTSMQHEDLAVIRPFATITRHPLLKFDVTKDQAWWIATGTTLSDPPSGLIEIRNVENGESRIIEGMVSCIAEVEKKALLVSASVTPNFQLRLCVQQLDPSDSGQPSIPVDVRIDMVEEKDYPRDIIVLHPLLIVAVMTEKSYSYFFELHSGAYLYTQAQKSYRFCPGQSAKRELLLWSHEKSDVRALTINEDDLIRYCRKVLKDDSLAEAIASRTGHRGAEDIILDDM